MSKISKNCILVFVILIISGSYSFTQNLDSDFRKVCFCSVGVAHPYSILNLDNNWDLLFAFKNGKSLTELDSLQIWYTKSQITILSLWDLIEQKDNKYYTTVPIIYSDNTKIIRSQTRQYAQEINSLIEADYNKLTKTLEDKNLEKNSFPVFFAFVLDDLVWQDLRKDSLIKQNKITKENPFWDGTMWLIQPERDFSCGTNSIGYENYYLSINWNGKLNIDLPDYTLLKQMLKDYKENGKITNSEVIENLKKYQFFNDDGELLLPVITDDSTNQIYMQSEQIAEKVADYLTENIDLNIVINHYPAITKEQAMLIIYHEIMWDILDIMEENGDLNKPQVFKDPENATEIDLKDLVFIVKY